VDDDPSAGAVSYESGHEQDDGPVCEAVEEICELPDTTGTPAPPTAKVLQEYAAQELARDNKAQALLNILAKAVELNSGAEDPGAAVAADLKAVLVGTGFSEGRGEGPHFVGNGTGIGDFVGATGFKPHLRDPHFQVQHAAAGLLIAYEHGGKVYGPILEQNLVESELHGSALGLGQPQDASLYRATFPIGAWMRDLDATFIRPDAVILVPGNTPQERITALPALMQQAICDSSCVTPPIR
jgi:hypothetical protein